MDCIKKDCIMSNVAGHTTFRLRKTEMHIPVVTLNTDDNLKLTKLLSKGFKRSIFWNEYKSKIETNTRDSNDLKRILLDSSFQGVNRLFVAAYENTENKPSKTEMNSHSKYVLPRVNFTKFNVLINGRNFYDQPISDEIKKI